MDEQNNVFTLANIGFIDDIISLLTADPSQIHATDVNQDSVLHHAAYGGKIKILEYLLDHGADVNARNSTDSTPLHRWISCQNNTEGAKLLISRGALLNAVDNANMTSFLLAILLDKTKLINYLALERADPNIVSSSIHYSTCLGIAADKGNLTLVETLMDLNADPNCKDASDRAPLHMAAMKHQINVVEYLVLDHDADLFAKNFYNQTPWEFLTEDEQAYLSDEITWKLRRPYLKFFSSCCALTTACHDDPNCASFICNDDWLIELISYVAFVPE